MPPSKTASSPATAISSRAPSLMYVSPHNLDFPKTPILPLSITRTLRISVSGTGSNSRLVILFSPVSGVACACFGGSCDDEDTVDDVEAEVDGGESADDSLATL